MLAAWSALGKGGPPLVIGARFTRFEVPATLGGLTAFALQWDRVHGLPAWQRQRAPARNGAFLIRPGSSPSVSR